MPLAVVLYESSMADVEMTHSPDKGLADGRLKTNRRRLSACSGGRHLTRHADSPRRLEPRAQAEFSQLLNHFSRERYALLPTL